MNHCMSQLTCVVTMFQGHCYYHSKHKLNGDSFNSFGRTAFSYSAIQPPFDILTSPGHWATLGNQCLCLPGVQATYGTQEYLTCTDTALSGHQVTPWSSGASEIHFLCPEIFTLGQCRIQQRNS